MQMLLVRKQMWLMSFSLPQSEKNAPIFKSGSMYKVKYSYFLCKKGQKLIVNKLTILSLSLVLPFPETFRAPIFGSGLLLF